MEDMTVFRGLLLCMTLLAVNGQHYGNITKSLDMLEIVIAATVSFQEPFFSQLANRSSLEFNNAVQVHGAGLSYHYYYTFGFKALVIKSFSAASSSGNTDVTFDLIFRGDVNLASFKANIFWFPFLLYNGVTYDETALQTNTNLTQAIALTSTTSLTGCALYSRPCDVGYDCNVRTDDDVIVDVLCTHKCQDKVCQNHGVCFYDLPSDTARCSCTENDDYVFSGEDCSKKTEKLKMKSRYIIAIAAGCGGLVILTLVFIIVAMRACCWPTDGNPGQKRDIPLQEEPFYNNTSSLHSDRGSDNFKPYPVENNPYKVKAFDNRYYGNNYDNRYQGDKFANHSRFVTRFHDNTFVRENRGYDLDRNEHIFESQPNYINVKKRDNRPSYQRGHSDNPNERPAGIPREPFEERPLGRQSDRPSDRPELRPRERPKDSRTGHFYETPKNYTQNWIYENLQEHDNRGHYNYGFDSGFDPQCRP